MLNLIYHFQSSQNQDEEFKPASYHVLYFFNEDGFLDQEQLRELSKAVPEADHQNLTFLNLDDLKAFGLRVAEEYQQPSVQMISVQDYNIGLDGARDLKGFQEIFHKYGEKIINEAVSSKKGFFSKFFS